MIAETPKSHRSAFCVELNESADKFERISFWYVRWEAYIFANLWFVWIVVFQFLYPAAKHSSDFFLNWLHMGILEVVLGLGLFLFPELLIIEREPGRSVIYMWKASFVVPIAFPHPEEPSFSVRRGYAQHLFKVAISEDGSEISYPKRSFRNDCSRYLALLTGALAIGAIAIRSIVSFDPQLSASPEIARQVWIVRAILVGLFAVFGWRLLFRSAIRHFYIWSPPSATNAPAAPAPHAESAEGAEEPAP